jgi:hypothetical protein
MKLPYQIKIGHTTFNKDTDLVMLVNRASDWYNKARTLELLINRFNERLDDFNAMFSTLNTLTEHEEKTILAALNECNVNTAYDRLHASLGMYITKEIREALKY